MKERKIDHCMMISRKSLVFLSSILFYAMQLVAQERFEQPPARYLTSFNFTPVTGGLMIVHARVNEIKDTFNFILDTGSGGISLNSSTVSYFKIPILPSEKTIRGVGGVKKVDFLYDATLHLPGLDVNNLNFHVNDYDLLSSAYGFRIDGIIGYSFLSRYIVEVNQDERIISVYTPGEYKYDRSGYFLHPVFNNIPMVDAVFKDAGTFQQKFYFDTGAGLNFLLSENYIKDSSVLAVKKTKPVPTQAEGVGGKAEMYLTTVKRLKIGPYKFKKVPTHLFNDEFNVTNYPINGGLIGNDLLRRFNIVLNYPEREIYIKPNSHYRDPFDYAYSGLAIFKIDNSIVIDGIAKNSPAEKAGFMEGDIVLSINSDFSGNLMNYKNIIQSSEKVINFLIQRENKPVILYLKTVKIK